MKRKNFGVLIFLGLILAACVPSQEQIDQIVSSAEQTAIAQVTVVAPTADVDQIVQATFQALTAQAATPTSSATTGSISGSLNYPAEGIPPLRIVAYSTSSNQYFYVDTLQNANTYQIDDLPAGVYHVVAYNGSLSAGYSQAVPCGLDASCADHSLIDVNVVAGQDSADINPFDWYAPQGAFPTLPAEALQQGGTDNIATNTPPGGQAGSIAGTLSYPSEGIPPLAVVAFHVGGGQNDYYYVHTQQNQSIYQIDNLPVGTYHIVAYTMGGNGFPSQLPGGYTQYVVCGMQQACVDHALVDVAVNAGQVTGNINLQDWYAPDGTFPPYPLP